MMPDRSAVWVMITLCIILLIGIMHLLPPSSHKTQASSGAVITILPLGDSITYGVGSSDKGGYRTFLWKDFVRNGYKVWFVGSLSNGPDAIDTHHEGHPGWRIDQISSHVITWLLLYRPQIILLFIGTNDILQRDDVIHAPNRLRFLIAQITLILPRSTLIVASVTPLDNSKLYARPHSSFPSSVDFNANILAYDAAIPAIVRADAAQGKHVQYVDMYDAVPLSDVGDGIHPDDAGYARMANVWYAALVKLL
jgi:lysophospholipase L1-like esterase